MHFPTHHEPSIIVSAFDVDLESYNFLQNSSRPRVCLIEGVCSPLFSLNNVKTNQNSRSLSIEEVTNIVLTKWEAFCGGEHNHSWDQRLANLLSACKRAREVALDVQFKIGKICYYRKPVSSTRISCFHKRTLDVIMSRLHGGKSRYAGQPGIPIPDETDPPQYPVIRIQVGRYHLLVESSS